MIKFGERYYDEWFGNVYSILLNDIEIGLVDYKENETNLDVNILLIQQRYKKFEYFKDAVDILKAMFPGKILTGLVGPVGCYCGDVEDWEALGATTYTDPDDDMFTVFELENPIC